MLFIQMERKVTANTFCFLVSYMWPAISKGVLLREKWNLSYHYGVKVGNVRFKMTLIFPGGFFNYELYGDVPISRRNFDHLYTCLAVILHPIPIPCLIFSHGPWIYQLHFSSENSVKINYPIIFGVGCGARSRAPRKFCILSALKHHFLVVLASLSRILRGHCYTKLSDLAKP